MFEDFHGNVEAQRVLAGMIASQRMPQTILLAGPEGKLIDMFLDLAGVDHQRIYRASALPCHERGVQETVPSPCDWLSP